MTTETALHYHLQHNHYPPVNVGMIPFAQEAIDNVEKGLLSKLVHVEGPGGSLLVTTNQLLTDLHLHGFVEEARA